MPLPNKSSAIKSSIPSGYHPRESQRNLYINMDAPLLPGKAVSAMFGNFCNVTHMTHHELWYPTSAPDTVAKIKKTCLRGQRFSGNIVLIGHGKIGVAGYWRNNGHFMLNGADVIDMLNHLLPEEYIMSTTNIFFLQCKASLSEKEGDAGYQKFSGQERFSNVDSARRKLKGSLILDAAIALSHDRARWHSLTSIYGNRYVTRYEPGALYVNCPTNGTHLHGVKLITDSDIVNPDNYSTSINL